MSIAALTTPTLTAGVPRRHGSLVGITSPGMELLGYSEFMSSSTMSVGFQSEGEDLICIIVCEGSGVFHLSHFETSFGFLGPLCGYNSIIL